MRATALFFIAGASLCFGTCLKMQTSTIPPAILTHFKPKSRPIDEATFRKMRLGMTPLQIENLLGRPGDTSTMPLIEGNKTIHVFTGENGQPVEYVREQQIIPPTRWEGMKNNMTTDLGSLILCWNDNNGAIFVAFENERATLLVFSELRRDHGRPEITFSRDIPRAMLKELERVRSQRKSN